MTIDESFKTYKRSEMKIIYHLMFEKEKSSFLKRFITKISKLDENNQYRYAIAKSMHTSSFRQVLDFEMLFMFY